MVTVIVIIAVLMQNIVQRLVIHQLKGLSLPRIVCAMPTCCAQIEINKDKTINWPQYTHMHVSLEHKLVLS